MCWQCSVTRVLVGCEPAFVTSLQSSSHMELLRPSCGAHNGVPSTVTMRSVKCHMCP
jgi:hypothetical protein